MIKINNVSLTFRCFERAAKIRIWMSLNPKNQRSNDKISWPASWANKFGPPNFAHEIQPLFVQTYSNIWLVKKLSVTIIK